MQSGEITWKIVSNTVANRMIDHSLIHKLIPSRRLRRKNKVMNIALKQVHSLKTYSQYIKMKTSILRNLSDDSETDDNVSFTEDDYNILYKSDLSLANYMTQMSNKTRNYSCFETEFETTKNDIIYNKKNTETSTRKLKSKSLKTINLGWQRIIKNKTKKASSSTNKTKTKVFTDSNVTCCQMDDIQSNTQTKLKTIDKFFITCSKNNALNSTKEVSINNKYKKAIDTYTITANSNEVISDTTIPLEITNSDNNEVVQPNPMTDNSEKFQLNENHSVKMLGSSNTEETLKGIKKNLTSLLDNVNEIQNTNDSLDQNHSTQLEKDQNSKEIFIDEVKNYKFPIIQTSVIGSTHQPKDSGIEEDTEEEFLEHGKKQYKKLKTQKADQNAITTSFIENYKSNLTDCDDNLKSKSFNIQNKSDFKDTASSINENVHMYQKDYKKKVQKHKLQPKVTHTEIFNKKYKIICSTSVFNKCAELEKLNMKDCFDEKHEKEETEQYIEDSISPLTKKRLQQLRRLNLTADSDSSLSENDGTYCTIENMRDKLFKRSKEFSDTLDGEDESVNCKHETSNQSDKKLQKNENPLKRITYCLNNENNILKQCSKVKKDSFVDIEQLSFIESVPDKLTCLESTIGHNFNYKEDTEGSKGKNLKIECMIESVNKDSVIYNRPYNLQELIKKENLTLEMTAPSFKFKDIHEEDELFIIDIPSVVLENQLLGNKIILTENRLKLGKQKYKVECKDIDKISCVFANKKPDKPYKTVIIKPTARVVTREKINSTYNADNAAK